MTLNPRKAKLLEALPKNNWKVEPSAIEAGYSKSYARKQQKQILRSALKDQATEALEIATNPASTNKDIKQSLAEIIGFTRQDVFNRLKTIATQDKDLSSALKVLAPLAKDLGVNLNTDEAPKTIVPILNIGVRNGLVEPYNETATNNPIIGESIHIDSIDNGGDSTV